MGSNLKIMFIQILLILGASLGSGCIFFNNDSVLEDCSKFPDAVICIKDSNGIIHTFDEMPKRVAMTNTYAATVLRMLDVDPSIIVGVSGDFYEELLWPEFVDTKIIQNSAHSEIDYEALLDSRPEVYIVFATNGMIDTEAIREKLEPVGIKVIGLDFYKYDSLRYEIMQLATLFNKQDNANKLFEEFDKIELEVENRIQNLNESERPRIVMEHHASLTRDPVVLTGTSQWSDIIEKAGGNHTFKEYKTHTTHVDVEAIIGNNPDIIMFDGITFDIGFNSYDEEGMCESHLEFIRNREGFSEVWAIKNNTMVIMSGEFAGPMMIHGLPTLAKILHPNLFDDLDAESYLDEYFEKYHGLQKQGKFVCLSE